MKFFDYYENIEEISPSRPREENLERLREALRIWRKRQGDEARITENYINRALEVFSDPQQYEGFRKWWEERQAKKAEVTPEEEFRKLVLGAAIDKIITPTEYQMLLREAKRLKISSVESIIQKIATEQGAIIGEEEAQPLGIPVLEVEGSRMEFTNVKIGASQSRSFTISNIGGGSLRGALNVSQPWIKVPHSIDPARHKQEITVSVDTRGLMPGFAGSGVIELKTNGGNSRITVNLTTEGYEDALNRFKTGLAIASGFGGGGLGSLFGHLGEGGAVFFCLAAWVAIGYSIYHWRLYKRGCITWVGILAMFGALSGLAVLCENAPVAGGVVNGIIASVLFPLIFSERLFAYQCSNLAKSPAISSAIMNFKRKIIPSVAIVAAIIMVIIAIIVATT